MRRTDVSIRLQSPRASALFTLLTLLVLSIGTTFRASGQANPTLTFNQVGREVGIGSSSGKIAPYPNSDYGGTVEHLAANTRGDVFGNVSTGSNSSYVFELPISGSGAVTLLYMTASTYWGHSVYVDKSNNIWVADSGDAAVIFIPFVNNSYPTNQGSGTTGIKGIPNCSAFPVPATQTTDCIVPLSFPGSIGYYGQPADIGFDSAGDLYLLVAYTSSGNYTNNDILLQYTPANAGGGTVLNATISHDNNAQLAVNPAGDAFVAAYGSVNEYPHTGYGTAVGVPSLSGPNGVTTDLSGNLFITQNSAGNIIEYPYNSDAYNLNTPFIVAQINNTTSNGDTSAPSQGVSVDGVGRINVAGGYPNSMIALTIGSLQFGSTPFNTTSGAATLNVIFNAAVTFGGFTATGPFNIASTTCSGSYVAGGNCAVSVTYGSSAVGTQLGQLVASDSLGNVLGTAVLSGIGTAATLTADPGTNANDGTGYTAPSAVATDNAGNIFVADSSTGIIYKTSTGSAAAATPIATGLTAPSALLVDGAENLYVAETGQVVELPYNSTAATYGAPSTVITGLSGPSGLAIDTVGTVYIADSGNSRVLRLASSGNLPIGSLVSTVGSGFTTPVAVAVDSDSQNVYISDAGTNSVLQVNNLTSSQSTVLSGLTTAAGVAVDPSGTLYAVDSGKTTITRLPFIAGGINPNFETTLSTIVKRPTAIAADNEGNLYVADTADALIATDSRSAGIVAFGNITSGQTSSVIAGQVSNSGNAGLTLATPYYTESGASGSFNIQASSTCAGGDTLTGGQSCTVAATFSPTSYGVLTDTLSLLSSAANSATLALTGTGTPVLIDTTLNLAVTSAGSPTFGQPVTITATLVPASNAPASPTGSVTFYVDNVVQQPPSVLNAAGTQATITLTNLSGGPHSITASYSGDYFYSSTSSAPLSVTVATSSTTTTMTISAPDSNPTAANPPTATTAQNVILTATVAPPVSGTPTGTVTFYNGKTSLGTATVVPYTPKGGPSEGQASLTVNTLANPLPLGQYEITATYNGDANYTPSTSTTPVALLISNPTILLTPSATSITGGGAPITVVVSSIAGFASTADLSCSGLPQYAACSFSPTYATVNPGTSATISFQVLIDQPPPIVVPGSMGAMPRMQGRVVLATLLTLFLFLPSLLFGYNRIVRRGGTRGFTPLRLLTLTLFAILTGLTAASLSGCSNSTANYKTPAGTTTITLNALTTAASAGGTNPVPDPNPTPTATLQLQLIVN